MRLRASALGGLLMMVAALLAAAGPSAASTVVGHPRCNLDAVAVDYTWWSDGVRVAITTEPELEWEGAVVAALQVDCSLVVGCLLETPALAGRAATIVGTPQRDVLVGTNGPDVIVGRAGPDRIEGKRGRDTLCGGPGNDILIGGRSSDVLLGRTGRDIIYGGTSPDHIEGGAGGDVLRGGRGDDLIFGDNGHDALYGDAGADDLRGGRHRDVCFGGDDADSFISCGVAAEEGSEYGDGPLHVYRVRVDPLLDESLVLATADVEWVLSDTRSWIGGGEVKWRRVGATEPADLTIILAAPSTVDAICWPLRTGGYFSCRNGDTIGINVNRWNTATDWWPATLQVYRNYVVNHEVGHYLGHGHTSCPGSGEWADVMQQQTKTLDGCVANGWVYPQGDP